MDLGESGRATTTGATKDPCGLGTNRGRGERTWEEDREKGRGKTRRKRRSKPKRDGNVPSRTTSEETPREKKKTWKQKLTRNARWGGKCVHASQGKETHKNMASAEVIWGCVRNNSAFLKKGGNGAQFAAEPGNLTHRNSFKCSGETNGSNATENRTKGWMDADRSDPKNPWERDADGRTKTTTDATSTARTTET